MPPKTKTVAPKINNNILVWNALAKQINVTDTILGKVNIGRLRDDLGVGTANAANTSDSPHSIEPTAKEKKAGSPLKKQTRESSMFGPPKRGATKKVAFGKRKKMQDANLTDEGQKVQVSSKKPARIHPKMNSKKIIEIEKQWTENGKTEGEELNGHGDYDGYGWEFEEHKSQSC
ncbi:hypothetical protein SBOR_8177 [Sclerotinia borealis F-4128]|uniref:Uncharacterized protein n=1 Tax=Sclerotinia borealis (strain F-4128) TaxID=1432307 RepID=W9C9A8_SCLBF|nr:hypothetical protein SBOR_8177 [Sclerotinia borealis F-4128]